MSRNNIYTQVPIYADADIERAFKWFLSFIPKNHWELRRRAIKETVQIEFKKSNWFETSLSEMKPISVKSDRIGWYLYLIETLLYNLENYEPVQGARVAPIFKRFGQDIEILKTIGGIERKIKRLLKTEKSQADSTFFEILTALLWAKNGWAVSFIPENSNKKTADLSAIKNGEEKIIECKRLSTSSDYSMRERDKWLSLISPIRGNLIYRNLVLNVKFHVELHLLDNQFLYDQLINKIPLITQPGKIISDDLLEVDVDFADIKSINSHLQRQYVKYFSPQLGELIMGKKINSESFTGGIIGEFVTIGEQKQNNLFVSSVTNVFAAQWDCDAAVAIDTKARNISRQLNDAIQQFPNGMNAVIHTCLETLDGQEVERRRFEKIMDTISFFRTGEKKVQWIFCHFLQSYAPPDQTWVIDETVSRFSTVSEVKECPLKTIHLIVPEEEITDDVHWEKEHP
jgi:hypothetical protein